MTDHAAVYDTTVDDYIDAAPIRGLIVKVPILCGLLMLAEGMDTYGVGYVSPALSKAYDLSPSILGVIYTGTVVASLIGAVLVAPLSDKLGRRGLLIFSSLLMGICTLLTPFASNEIALFIVRFLIGVGFGAAVPTAYSLTADYAPKRARAKIIMIMGSAIALGMVLSGVAAAYLIPAFGWKSLLFATGAFSLVCSLGLIFTLPESLKFLILRKPKSAVIPKLIAILARERNAPAPERLISRESVPTAAPVRALFTDGRLIMTCLLWFAMSMAYSVEFFMSYWLPTVLLNAGASMFNAGLITGLGKIGSLLGAVGVGWLMDRLGAGRSLSLTFVLAAAAIVVLASVNGQPLVGLIIMLTVFFFLDGSFGGTLAQISQAYPDSMRATGTGWVSGFARLIGGGGGTFAGGLLVDGGMSFAHIAWIMAAVLVLGGIAQMGLYRLKQV